MTDRMRLVAAVGLTVVLFVAVQFGALALIEPFDASDRHAVDNPDDPTNSLIYVGVILLATGFMLATFKYDLEWLVHALLVGVSVLLAWFVFTEFFPPVAGVESVNVLAVVAALGLGAALVAYPEWWVIDLAGIVMGAGAAALFGISFGLLPAIVLLSILAVYDAISVYGTEHMLDLADGVMDLNVPVILIAPTTLSYSSLALGADADSEENPADRDESHLEETPLERDALYIGLGDAVIPTVLVVSAAFFLDSGTIDVPGIVLTLPALGAALGTIAGLLVLMTMVLKGRPHAGLPLLNGGAIGGYLLGAMASGVPLLTALGL